MKSVEPEGSVRNYLAVNARHLALLYFALCTLHFALTSPVVAEDKKPDAPKQPPHVLMTLPLAVTSGSTTKVTLRGLNLDDATEVRAELNHTPLKLKIKSKGKADL